MSSKDKRADSLGVPSGCQRTWRLIGCHPEQSVVRNSPVVPRMIRRWCQPAPLGGVWGVAVAPRLTLSTWSGLVAPTVVLQSAKNRPSRHRAEDSLDPLSKPTTIDAAALHVVSVPIGNLKDFTLRALDVLGQVDYIITTDRPATKTLLDIVNIESQGRLIQYNATSQSAGEKLMELLRGGRSMALVSASGTPCIGDVGSDLVRFMVANNVRVTAVPGASAVMASLSIAGVTSVGVSAAAPPSKDEVEGHRGLPVIRDGSFFFGNILPESTGSRLRYLRRVVATAEFPCVFYELPRRLLTVLQDIAVALPQRRVIITHELTKLNEAIHADTAERLAAFYMQSESQIMLKKGQLVLIVEPAGPKELEEWARSQQAKRRQHRLKLRELHAAEPPADLPPALGDATARTLERRRTCLKQRRAARRRVARNRLIAKIEAEQERLRLVEEINRSQAKRV